MMFRKESMFSAVMLGICASPTLAQFGPAVVEVTSAERREIIPKQWTVGSVMPSRRAVIGSAVDGRVTELLVREGDRVEADQPLAQLLVETISLEIESAEAELEFRQAELQELQNGSRPEELAQAKARAEATRVLAEYLQANQKRFSELGNTSAVSRSEFENALSMYEEAVQRHIEAKAAYELAIEGPRKEKLLQAEARVKMQKAVVDRLTDQRKKHTMFSRFAGYVTVEHTEVGQWLPRGEPVAEIVALDEVDMLAKVVEAHIPFIHLGDPVKVEVPALRQTFPGVVHAVIQEADQNSRTFTVKVRVQNVIDGKDGPKLKAGMLARALLPIEEPKTVLAVPKDALVLGGQSTPTIVWVINDDAKRADGGMLQASAGAVPVTTGSADDEWIEVKPIAANIADGAFVVTRGNERIPPSRPGAPSLVTWLEQTASVTPTSKQ